MVRKHLLTPPWGPPVGRLAERIFDDGHHHALVDLLVDRTVDWVRDNHETVNRLVTDRSPHVGAARSWTGWWATRSTWRS